MKNAIFILALIFLAGCASISQQDAEQKAVGFVESNVRFFAKDDNSTVGLPQFTIDRISSINSDSNWDVVMHVTAKSGNETKQNDLSVKLDRKGNVLELNGKAIPKN